MITPEDRDIAEALSLSKCSQIPVDIVRELGSKDTSIYNTIYQLACKIYKLRLADEIINNVLTHHPLCSFHGTFDHKCDCDIPDKVEAYLKLEE
jgi:hypothetical protein